MKDSEKTLKKRGPKPLDWSEEDIKKLVEIAELEVHIDEVVDYLRNKENK